MGSGDMDLDREMLSADASLLLEDDIIAELSGTGSEVATVSHTSCTVHWRWLGVRPFRGRD